MKDFVFKCDSEAEARAFVNGFLTCRHLASGVIQNLPMDAQLRDYTNK
jgi:hypothetical protein